MIRRITILLLMISALAFGRETTYVYPPWSHTVLGLHRIGSAEVSLFSRGKVQCANPQGIAAVKMKELDDPDSGKDDIWLTLFAVNSDRGEIVYNPGVTSVHTFGSRGHGEGEFFQPMGIAANDSGQVLVADTGNHRLALLQFRESGNRWLLRYRLQWRGSFDNGDPAFKPVDVCWCEKAFWVADASTGKVFRFDREGKFLGEWPLQISEPLKDLRGIAVISPRDPWSRLSSFQLLLVADEGRELHLFNRRGKRIARRSPGEIYSREARFHYPAFDLRGQALLADQVSGKLFKLDKELEPLKILETLDEDPVPLNRPTGIAIWRRYGMVFIAEQDGGVYLWTGTDILNPRLSFSGSGEDRDRLVLEYSLSERSFVEIYLRKGQEESLLISKKNREEGFNRQILSLDPDILEADVLVLKARPLYSARKHLNVERLLPIPELKHETR